MLRLIPCWAVLVTAGFALPAAAQDARALLAQQAALREPLATSPFGRPLVLVSSEVGGDVQGDVYAVVNQPYASLRRALVSATDWCEILLLHLNVKGCIWRGSGANTTLTVDVGRQYDQPIEDAYQVDFGFKLAANTADYLQVHMSAAVGPLGTKNYRLEAEAVAIDAQSSFMHMSYAYGHGVMARVAMQTYLATTGRSKVGFTIVDRDAEGKPIYIDGLRGVMERNAMRYYLAIEAHLKASTLPPADQAQGGLMAWFDGTERYARQLHELDRDEYLTMKRKELARSRAAATEVR